MRSIGISTQVFLDCNKEIGIWLRENKAVTLGSVIHPVSNYYNSVPRVIITFEDPELAILFKLTWG